MGENDYYFFLNSRDHHGEISNGHEESINLTELEPRPRLMRRAFSVDNYQKLDSSPSPNHNVSYFDF